MSATTTRTYRPLLTGLVTDTYPMAGAYLIEWQRQINSAWAHLLAPTVLHGCMMIGDTTGASGAATGFLFTPADTAEYYQFPLGTICVPNGYRTMRIGLSATRTVTGTPTCAFKVYIDRAMYKGPSSGTWTAGYATDAVQTGTITIAGTIGGLTASLTLPESPVSPTGFTLLYGWVTCQASSRTAGDTYRMHALSARLEP